jgi:phosphate/sulfate permease
VTAEEYALVQDPEFKLIVEEYAAEEAAFKNEFVSAWVYMMTVDRYAGLTTNVCTGLQDMPSSSAFTAVSGLMGMGHVAGVLALAIALVDAI